MRGDNVTCGLTDLPVIPTGWMGEGGIMWGGGRERERKMKRDTRKEDKLNEKGKEKIKNEKKRNETEKKDN